MVGCQQDITLKACSRIGNQQILTDLFQVPRKKK